MTVAPGTTKPNGKDQLKASLPLFGHRNWIVIADSAYPAQSRAGIDTIVSGASQIEAARTSLPMLFQLSAISVLLCMSGSSPR
jgi:L-fucose mutarotase/ribose pyranase (RbsD/FucU family)